MQPRISVIDTHTGGEPTRVVISGGPELGTGTMAERLAVFRDRYDTFRSAVVNEPRGSDVMVGAILLPPVDPACAAGVIFFNNVGYLGMCGHGTIGVAVALAYLGRIGPGSHRLETPVGTGDDHARRPQHRDDRQRRELPAGQGRERDGAGPEDLCGRRRLGRELVLPGAGPRRDLERGQRRTADRRDLADSPGLDARKESREPDGARSTISSSSARPPCRAPTARTSCFARARPTTARPAAPAPAPSSRAWPPTASSREGEVWRQESIIGSVFEGSVRIVDGRVRPRIRGTAYVNAESTLIIDPADPFAMGIRP